MIIRPLLHSQPATVGRAGPRARPQYNFFKSIAL